MQLKISYKNIKQFVILIVALLPLQLTIRLIFNLPSFLMLINIAIFLLVIFYCSQPAENKKLSSFKINIIYIYISLFLITLISVLINYSEIIEYQSSQFAYYVMQYSKFWDSSAMSSIYSGIIRPAIYFIFFYTLIFILQKEQDLQNLYKILLSIAIISCFYSIYQLFAYKYNLPFGSLCSGHSGMPITYLGLRRTEGIFYEGGPHATFLSFIFPLFIYQNFRNPLKRKRLYNIYLYLILILLLLISFTTLSPIGILTPFIVFAILILQNWKRVKTHNKYIIAFSIMFVLLFSCNIQFGGTKGYNKYTIKNYIISRIDGDFNNSALAGDLRTTRNKITIDLIKKHPFIGIGAGNDGFYYAKYAPYAYGNMPTKNVIINNNLKIFADYVIIGFLLYLLLLIYPFYFFVKSKLYNYKTTFFLDKLINSLFVAELLFVILTFQAQTEFLQPLFWIMYTMLISAIDIKRKRIKLLNAKGDFQHDNN